MTIFLCLTWYYKLSVSSCWGQPLLQSLLSASQPQYPGAAVLGLPVLFLHGGHWSRWPYSIVLITQSFHCPSHGTTPNVQWKSDLAHPINIYRKQGSKMGSSRYWGCVHMDTPWTWTACSWTCIKPWVWVQGSNLCLISPGNRWYACTNNLCCHPLFTINGWFVFLKGKDKSRLKIHTAYSKTGRKKPCTFSWL